MSNKLLILFLCFSPLLCNAQKYKPRVLSFGTSFFSGMAWGLHQETSHHWPAFSARFPGAKAKYWNPDVSWKNKYINGNPDNNMRKIPVQFTDAAHMLASANQSLLFCSGVVVVIGEKRKFSHYVIDAAINGVFYNVGFNFFYKKSKKQ